MVGRGAAAAYRKTIGARIGASVDATGEPVVIVGTIPPMSNLTLQVVVRTVDGDHLTSKEQP